MNKRYLTVILALGVLTAMLAGCAQASATVPSAGQTAVDTVQSADPAPAAVVPQTPPTEPPAAPATQPAPTDPPEMLTAARAEEIALEHAGLTLSQVERLRSHYELDDGREEYDVEFSSGDYEYDYTIDAYTGTILSQDREYEPGKAKEASATEPKADTSSQKKSSASSQTKASGTASKKTSGTASISAEDAKSIALKHAGLTAGQVTGLRAEYDADRDEAAHYDVEFREGRVEYDYEIHAQTGEILSSEKDIDD